MSKNAFFRNRGGPQGSNGMGSSPSSQGRQPTSQRYGASPNGSNNGSLGGSKATSYASLDKASAHMNYPSTSALNIKTNGSYKSSSSHSRPSPHASQTSGSWGVSSPYNPNSASSGHSGKTVKSSTWTRHRPQQASADFDNLVASVGLNRFVLSPTSERGTNDRGDTYVRMESPESGSSGRLGSENGGMDMHIDTDFDDRRAFSPPRYAGYAAIADDTPLSAVSAGPDYDDRFTPVPTPISRRRRSPSRQEEPRIGARALASPPPHERIVHPTTTTEESHDSGLSGSSAQTGLTDSSHFRPTLSSSTSTVVSSVTTVTSPTMGSDEMLMALMASQAAVDCDALPTGGWEEVESWKKELSLLSTRLDALQARHQREVKILTAARTLQKLNQTNKRLSKQTVSSLEQAEKRVDKAEKELLILREREAALRRRLMEHWAGVMAWEVRRLERQASEQQSRYHMHVRAAESDRESLIERLAAIDQGDRDMLPPAKMIDTSAMDITRAREKEQQAQVAELEQLLSAERARKAELEEEQERSSALMKELESDKERNGTRLRTLESERERRAGRIAELEEMVLDMGRRERALEDGAKGHDEKLVKLEKEREAWQRERALHAQEREAWEAEKAQHSSTRDEHASILDRHDAEKASWAAEREELLAERNKLDSERSTFETQTREHGAKNLAWIAERERLTADREALEAQMQKHIEDRNAWMAERDELVAARTHLETQSTRQIAERNAVWQHERDTLLAKHDRMAADLEHLANEHDRLKEEQRSMQQTQMEREVAVADKETILAEINELRQENSTLKASLENMSSSQGVTGRLAATLSAILGRTVAEPGLVAALEEVRTRLDTREAELAAMENRHEDNLQRLTLERDEAHGKMNESAKSSRAVQVEMLELVRKIRNQNEQIGDLTTQLEAAKSTPASAPSISDRALESKLENIWTILPTPDARAEAGLTDPRITSPNSTVNFAVLQKAYAGRSKERYVGVDELVSRIQGLVEDGRIMVERMQRMEVDKERHKDNAVRAAKLVHTSRANLETYKKQVAELEERLRDGGDDADGHLRIEFEALQYEVQSLQDNLDHARGENHRLQSELDQQEATINMSSSKILDMANEHEREMSTIQYRLQKEIDRLKIDLKRAVSEKEEERKRGHMQSAQMMGEMMDLQEQVEKLKSRR